MRNLKTIRKEASGVARAANGPLGARPLQRVVCDHLGFFAGLRAEGASWEQIAVLMASEGLRSRTGGVVNASVLRALFSRAAAEAPARAGHLAPGSPASGSEIVKTHIAAPVTPAGSEPVGGLLAEAIARAARLRGISAGDGSGDNRN